MHDVAPGARVLVQQGDDQRLEWEARVRARVYDARVRPHGAFGQMGVVFVGIGRFPLLTAGSLRGSRRRERARKRVRRSGPASPVLYAILLSRAVGDGMGGAQSDLERSGIRLAVSYSWFSGRCFIMMSLSSSCIPYPLLCSAYILIIIDSIRDPLAVFLASFHVVNAVCRNGECMYALVDDAESDRDSL